MTNAPAPPSHNSKLAMILSHNSNNRNSNQKNRPNLRLRKTGSAATGHHVQMTGSVTEEIAEKIRIKVIAAKATTAVVVSAVNKPISK